MSERHLLEGVSDEEIGLHVEARTRCVELKSAREHTPHTQLHQLMPL